MSKLVCSVNSDFERCFPVDIHSIPPTPFPIFDALHSVFKIILLCVSVGVCQC